MSMLFLDGGQARPDLTEALKLWTAAQPFWSQRVDVTSCDEWLPGYAMDSETWRRATVEEVAVALVNDPRVREALEALDSPIGQIVQRLIAETFLPGWQAKLLVEALAAAEQIILDENRPAWLRADVLMGLSVAVGVMILVGLWVRASD